MTGERSFSRFGASVRDLDTAWEDRLRDAQALREAGRFPTAVALGLYALEILLKTRICRRLDLDSLPRAFEIHDLESLLVLSGLRRTMWKRNARHIRSNWSEIKTFGSILSDLRYRSNSRITAQQADAFFDQLLNDQFGVLKWISIQP